MISNLVVYICSPCIIVDSFQIEMTDDKVKGLLLAVIAAIFVQIRMLAGTWLFDRLFHFNSIEKASIIYTNAGYLIIPLVGAVLGSDWVFYTTAFIIVQTVLMWTHCISLISEAAQTDYKKILPESEYHCNAHRACSISIPNSASKCNRNVCQWIWKYDYTSQHAGDRHGYWKCKS